MTLPPTVGKACALLALTLTMTACSGSGAGDAAPTSSPSAAPSVSPTASATSGAAVAGDVTASSTTVAQVKALPNDALPSATDAQHDGNMWDTVRFPGNCREAVLLWPTAGQTPGDELPLPVTASVLQASLAPDGGSDLPGYVIFAVHSGSFDNAMTKTMAALNGCTATISYEPTAFGVQRLLATGPTGPLPDGMVEGEETVITYFAPLADGFATLHLFPATDDPAALTQQISDEYAERVFAAAGIEF